MLVMYSDNCRQLTVSVDSMTVPWGCQRPTRKEAHLSDRCFGVAVVVSSLDNGIGWSSAGVDAGTFPFLTGIIIMLGSLYNLVRGVVPAVTLASVPIAIT